jgi:hypothetical protein
MAGRAGSLRDMLGLQNRGREGDALAGEFDVDGTTADVNTFKSSNGVGKAVIRRTGIPISRQCSQS